MIPNAFVTCVSVQTTATGLQAAINTTLAANPGFYLIQVLTDQIGVGLADPAQMVGALGSAAGVAAAQAAFLAAVVALGPSYRVWGSPSHFVSGNNVVAGFAVNTAGGGAETVIQYTLVLGSSGAFNT